MTIKNTREEQETLLSPSPGGHTDSYQPPLERRQVPVSDVASYDVATCQGGAHHPAPGHRVVSCHHVMSSYHVIISCHVMSRHLVIMYMMVMATSYTSGLRLESPKSITE